MIFAACVGCPAAPPAELWQIIGLAVVGVGVLVALGVVLLALDRLSG